MGDGDGDGMTSRFGGTDGGFEGGQGGAGGADGFDLAAELTRGLKALDESGEDEDEEDEDAEEDDEDEDDEVSRVRVPRGFAPVLTMRHLSALQDEDDDDDDGSAADSEDEEAVQLAQRQKLLNEEIRDLEAAVAKKRVEIEKSANVIIRVRPFLPPAAACAAESVADVLHARLCRNASRTRSRSSRPTWTSSSRRGRRTSRSASTCCSPEPP